MNKLILVGVFALSAVLLVKGKADFFFHVVTGFSLSYNHTYDECSVCYGLSVCSFVCFTCFVL